MTLAKYRQKREFSQTPEPAGARRTPSKSTLIFVVQKHAARNLHYDFRLELDGVLKSWAVPKGPSLDPHEKRLAVEVEDHPVEYGSFAGTIPAGQYGAGTVEIWDRGTWTPDGDPHEGLRNGKLEFWLAGTKLRGHWTLVRMRGHERNGKPNWLLIKHRDEEARPMAEYDVLNDAAPVPAKNGPAGRKRGTAGATSKPALNESATAKASQGTDPSRTNGARKAKMPTKIEPELATLVAQPPVDNNWWHEIKFDGYRLICRRDGGRARLLTRRGLDWTPRFPALAAAVEQLPVKSVLLDGEAVVLEPSGVSSFQALQEALSAKQTNRVIFYAFDLLYLDGYDVRDATLADRNALLEELLASQKRDGVLRHSEHFVTDGPTFLRECCRHGLEGIISKRSDQPYRSGRGTDWLKVKCIQHEEFVIGGFTEPTASRKGLGALLVGYYSPKGELMYAGRVGTGFSDRMLGELREKLAHLEQTKSPFANLTPRDAGRGVHWVGPKLVCQVEFTNWTRDHVLRHPSFQGLREDLPATSVVRDAPVPGGLAEAAPKEPSPRKRRVTKSRTKEPVSRGSQHASNSEAATVAGVRISHPDRVIYEDVGLTKQGLAEYYAKIADWVLPHVADRPLSLLRCPAGFGHECFFQKNLPPSASKALDRMTIKSSRTSNQFAVVRDVAGLVSLVQIGVLEIHPWGARTDEVDHPDRLIFDLDPGPGVDWSGIVLAARRLRELLASLPLESFVKTTGGKGLHVVVPIARRHDWDEAKAFARAVVERLAAQHPDAYLTKAAKNARPGKIYLDYLRNDRGATAVAAYSTRARAGAPVSTPVTWEELAGLGRANHFHVGNVPARLARLRHDPWAQFNNVRQSIMTKIKRSVERG